MAHFSLAQCGELRRKRRKRRRDHLLSSGRGGNGNIRQGGDLVSHPKWLSGQRLESRAPGYLETNLLHPLPPRPVKLRVPEAASFLLERQRSLGPLAFWWHFVT